MRSSSQLVRVAVPVPLSEGFDYEWPLAEHPPEPGCRVRVPFGTSEKIGIVLEHPEKTPVKGPKLKAVLEGLDRDPVIDGELLENLLWAADYYHHPVGEVLNHALPALLRRGRSAQCTDPRPSPPGVDPSVHATTPIPELTKDQRSVLDAIERDAGGYRAFLLHGVTGSGKTEVYLRLIAEHLTEGRQTLLLVPEIGLTPQLVARLNERFAGRLALMHSHLSPRERLDAWHRARNGEAGVVVGTRSAVFAPLPNAGLLIVDEEHDPSFKQQDGFRYSARDLAVLRARRLGVPIVLASATPSLESFHNGRTNRYVPLAMPQRIGSAGAPTIRMIDLNHHAARHSLSTPLIASIEQHLAAGSQVLLFLNRRGFAPALFCPECQTAEECTRCDARLTVHARKGKLRCHHCGNEQTLAWACAVCGAERIAVGSGTQRVTDELQGLFPDVRIARLDRDATSHKGSLEELLTDVRRGDTRILVGTQMLTKGHDFPGVTLVGVLNADQGLFGTDFRSSERLAQTILQVAGRAGRRDRPGEVLIQTHCPQHPLLRRLAQQDYTAFAELALQERRAARWPPYSHLVLWRAEAARREPVFRFLDKVKAEATKDAAEVSILGPAPASMERRGGRYRGHLLLQSAERAPLHALVDATLGTVRRWPDARRVRWAIDVDPVEL